MAFWAQTDAYGICDEDDDSSDVCTGTSSEDEIDIILHGTPEQKRKLKRLQDKQIADRLDERSRRNESSSSSGDEFEKEMNAELAQHVSSLEKSRDVTGRHTHAQGSHKRPHDNASTQEAFYDDVYFDSDEEESNGNRSGQGQRTHAVISNDDLLYDPTMDDKDQLWVDRQRRRNNNTILEGLESKNKKKPSKLPTSDALLDCPACLTTLCLDCQRHETYKNQYRAMFVMNCTVDNSEVLQCPEQPAKGKRKKKKTPENDVGPHSTLDVGSDLFNSVKCTECNTVVGVIDTDEVYHFFNVLVSHT